MRDYLKSFNQLGNSDSPDDAKSMLDQKLIEAEGVVSKLNALDSAEESKRCQLQIDAGYLYIDARKPKEAWDIAHEAFKIALKNRMWHQCVEATDIIYQADQSDSVTALAQGIWLGITFPVNPSLSVVLLQYFVDETPKNSDGAALAAAIAAYIVSLRAEDPAVREELSFFTSQLLGHVASRHSQIEDQKELEQWITNLGLDDPSSFLPKMSTVLDHIVEDQWWFDKDELRSHIPE